jgi:hypothetical protein
MLDLTYKFQFLPTNFLNIPLYNVLQLVKDILTG